MPHTITLYGRSAVEVLVVRNLLKKKFPKEMVNYNHEPECVDHFKEYWQDIAAHKYALPLIFKLSGVAATGRVKDKAIEMAVYLQSLENVPSIQTGVGFNRGYPKSLSKNFIIG
jgi:disulfide oxidoreductase YuzD